MKVITCISDTEHEVYRKFLEPSCRYHDVELVTLLYEDDWVSHRLRDELLRLYLPQLGRSEIVAFVDGYDSFLVGGEDELITKYAAFESPIVFSAEDNCWPYAGLAKAFLKTRGTRLYLNGGGFIGEAGVVLDLLERYAEGPPTSLPLDLAVDDEYRSDARAIDSRYLWSNQYYWSLIHLNHPELIALDREIELFAPLTLQPTASLAEREEFKRSGEMSPLYKSELGRFCDDYDMANGRLRCKATGALPIQVHFNGLVAKRFATNGVFEPLMPWLERCD